jgi:hypothetical protein
MHQPPLEGTSKMKMAKPSSLQLVQASVCTWGMMIRVIKWQIAVS